jgi:predicted TIM-barrel fold metal-dependent hydrolase
MRCDSHVHIVGPSERYPQLTNRSGTMAVADAGALRTLGATRGISRFVIVQPSFYGTDNSMLLSGLDALGGQGRGVAVAEVRSAQPDMLSDWGRRGVRGLRINLYSPVGPPKSIAADFAMTADVAQSMSWHVEVIAPLAVIVAHAEVLAGAKVPVVLDHYGVYGASRPDSAEGRRLLDVLAAPNVWMKLSAPYRVSNNPHETKPDPAWLTAILERAAKRCVWGSDWPHTPPHDGQDAGYRAIDYAALVDDFIAAVKSPDMVSAIMQDNPARLYGYPDGA